MRTSKICSPAAREIFLKNILTIFYATSNYFQGKRKMGKNESVKPERRQKGEKQQINPFAMVILRY